MPPHSSSSAANVGVNTPAQTPQQTSPLTPLESTITSPRTTEDNEPRMQQPHTTTDILNEDANDGSSSNDDSTSEYIDRSFDPVTIMRREPRPPRGKTFLPPKPAAVRTREQRKELLKNIADTKQKKMNENKESAKRRITTRQQKKQEREKREPLAKRLRSRRSYYNKHNTSPI